MIGLMAMRSILLTKAFIPPLIISILFLFFYFFSCQSSISFLQFQKTSSPADQWKELRQVLRRASMETRTIIITAIDSSTATPRRPGTPPAVDDFLESLKNGTATKHLVDHLVVLTFDPQTFHYCKSIHHQCFKYPKSNSLHDHQPHKLIGLLRNELLRRVLEFGYNFFYTDVILLWERNPLTLFGSEEKISIGCTGNAEYFHMKSGPLSITFFKWWKLINVIYHDTILHNSLCRLRFHEKFGPIVNSMIKFAHSTK